jgi:hypothetical protein
MCVSSIIEIQMPLAEARKFRKDINSQIWGHKKNTLNKKFLKNLLLCPTKEASFFKLGSKVSYIDKQLLFVKR